MHRINRLKQSIGKAAAITERTRVELVREMVALRISRAQIGFTEYFDYGLYRNDLTSEEKREFVGWRQSGLIDRILVDDLSRILSLDKFTTYALWNGSGIPFPAIKAAYGRYCPPGLCPSLDLPESLKEFLTTDSSFPVYVKPSHGSYGKGNAMLYGCDNGNLVLGDGSMVPVDQFCESLSTRPGLGWIFQEPLSAHADIADLCGDRISGVRVHSFMTSSGPRVFRAIWKINVGTRDSDNFQYGSTGNMIADVDVDTGRITRVVRGIGFDQETDSVHPGTGENLLNFHLPYWNEIKKVVRKSHHLFPGFISPGWDVAICDQGPVLLEVNAFGDVDLTQHAARRGFLDQEFIKMLEDRGIAHLIHHWFPRRDRRTRGNWRGRLDRHWDWW